jgi:hypothetical protein
VITNAPTNVSFAYTAALGDQKASGANSSQMPTTVLAHCVQAKRGDSDSSANSTISRPLTTSLQAVSVLRSAGSQRLRSAVTRCTAELNADCSNVPNTNGVVRSQAPRTILRKCTHSMSKCMRRISSWCRRIISCCSTASVCLSCSCAFACTLCAATRAAFSLLVRYHRSGSALSVAIIFGSVARSERLGSQPSSRRAREMSSS